LGNLLCDRAHFQVAREGQASFFEAKALQNHGKVGDGMENKGGDLMKTKYTKMISLTMGLANACGFTSLLIQPFRIFELQLLMLLWTGSGAMFNLWLVFSRRFNEQTPKEV